MDITYLKGVGPKRAELYRKLGIETAEQLIELYPRDYVDLTAPVTVAQAHIGEVCAFRAFVMSKKSPFNEYARMALYKAVTDRRYRRNRFVRFFGSPCELQVPSRDCHGPFGASQ